jgi:hypothetical protein|tara:strand:+ start:3884 stop:4342 length:459 start_codon:yes stop_codon:yes gene_type:complete
MNNVPDKITTGFENDLNNLEKEELKVNVTSSILSFMEYAIKTSEIYVNHSNRKIIDTKDIKKAMMLEVFLYFDRVDLNTSLQKWRNTILYEMENDDNYISEDDEEEDEEDEENIKVCECEICSHINNIEEKWKIYEPSDELGKIFKKHIDTI